MGNMELGSADLGSMALSAVIDCDLKRRGEYRDRLANKLASAGCSAFLGAVGTAVGGPVLGMLMGGVGHCMGQGTRFDEDDHPSHSTTPTTRPRLDYDNRRGGLFDYGSI